MEQYVYVFNSPTKSKFSGGVFSKKHIAEQWIKKNMLTGILTKYPLDIGVYDWVIKNELFSPKNDNQIQADFIGGFSSASQEHNHYENGVCVD